MKNSRKNSRIIHSSMRSFYRWHRRLGITAALFVILLTITGVLLNHNASLNLQKAYIKNEWLLDWYNIDAKQEDASGFPEEIRTVDRVVLDIHTGRFFCEWGPYVMDGAALCLFLLAITGIYMWSRRSLTLTKKNRK